MTLREYLDHDITIRMSRNNLDFYGAVCSNNFDIKNFELVFKRTRWQPLHVVKFITFGRLLDPEYVFHLLSEWVPNWRAQFWWFVIFFKTFRGRI